MKESSLAYDLLRECKQDSYADKVEHIATVCLIVSDKVIVIVLCAQYSSASLRILF